MGAAISLQPRIAEVLLYVIEEEERQREAEAALQAAHMRWRTKNRHRNRGHALNEIDHVSEKTFSKMFRMDRASFGLLLGKVSPFLQDTDEERAIQSSGAVVTKQTKLYATLRWLAGGSYLDICFGWGLAEGSFFNYNEGIVWPVINALDKCFLIGLPTDTAELNKMADDFSKFSGGQLHGCVTAIDGWVARTRKPHVGEVDDIMAYRNRHDCWGLVVLAGCDAHCRFTMWSCQNSGSTNDCLAWDLSTMKRLLEQGKLPAQFFLIGDEAFSCTDQLLVPYSGRGLGAWKDSFNYHLSAMRQCIERSFALLTNRWGILWRNLRCNFNRWPLLLTVCAKLHNFCTDQKLPELPQRYDEDVEEGDSPDVLLNYLEENEPLVARVANRRTIFTAKLESDGVRRPAHASSQSRE